MFIVIHCLRLEGMDEVKEVAAEGFPSLETLIVKNMVGWKQWSCSNGLIVKFPKLCTLTLVNCPSLVGNWPICLPSLRQLEIRRCPQLADLPKALPSLCELEVGIHQEVISNSVHHFTSLIKLTINGILGPANFHEGFVRALDALKDLVIQCCHQLNCLCEDGNALGKLANLKSLRVEQCAELLSLVGGEEELLPCNLQVLSISECDNLEKLPNGLYSLTSPRELEILRCPRLVSFPEGAGLPCCLRSLEIEDCESLESLPHGMTTITMNGRKNQQCLLEEIRITNCPSLKYFPEGRLPITLKQLDISGCENCEFPGTIFQVDDAHDDESHHCPPHLEDLSVHNFSLASFPTGFEFPASLKTLHVENCLMLKSLPSSSLHTLSHLIALRIAGCNELVLFPEEGLPLPSLIKFHIWNCEKLRCLPNHIENLTSLRELIIFGCNNIEYFPKWGFPPNLNFLWIKNCEKLTRQQMSREWGLHMLTSLKRLDVSFYPSGGVDDYFPDADGLLLPTSLTDLQISNHKNLKSISRGIQHLTSLKELWIINCPNLKYLPKEGFPATLGRLEIHMCPPLAERCSEKKGDYWPIIAHIPEVVIQ